MGSKNNSNSNKTLSIEEAKSRAIELIPKEIEKFLQNVGSIRTRTLLQLREFSTWRYKLTIADALEISLVRLFASELINKAGVKKFGKSIIYNRAKLEVRKEIWRYINENPDIKLKLKEAIKSREKGLFARFKTAANK
ncbi:MAG: hypothetical protein Q8N60_04175, partial [Candidatus Diapherotrites archaeon]|nr:hypothetical protein [Candidatus Diapherotrites archaeon]